MKTLLMTVEQLLQRFPNGFAVRPNGEVYEVMEARADRLSLPLSVPNGGYLAVRAPVVEPGDEFYGQSNGNFEYLTPQGMADALDRLIKMADTMKEDEILSKLYTTYSERLQAAAKELLNGMV